jgi:signal transduction histidine kinase
MLDAINNAQKTLFGRLLLIFLATASSILIVLSLSLKMATKDGESRRSKFATLFGNHAAYIVNDIGIPPNIQRAKTVAETSHIQLMISGPELLWKSSEEITNPDNIKKHKAHHQHKNHNNLTFSMGRYQSQHFFIIQKQNHTFYLTGLRPFVREDGYLWAWAALLLCGFILYLSYRAVNWLIEPLKQIKQGAQRIEKGELSYRINCTRNDEIGQITNAVNSMATELEKMLEAKRQLLLAISHELRTPLTRAKVGIEFIDNQKIKHSLHEDLAELDHLINALLEAERLNEKHNALHISPININTLIETIKGETPDPKNLIRTQLSDTAITINGDPLRLTLLIKNLIGNGLKYGNEKSLVISCSEKKSILSITFEDQGDGIDETHLAHITEPFYRADDARQRQTGGYGLGLYLCKLIAEAHDGQINITSTLKKGTRIAVTLPLRPLD